jgi:Peptidase_C39 like family
MISKLFVLQLVFGSLMVLTLSMTLADKRLTLDSGNATTFKSDGIILKAASNVTVKSYGWTEFKQCDSRWANQQLGTCDETLCSAGCAMTSVAMMLNTKGTGHDPSTLDFWLTDNGGYSGGCNIIWSRVDAFGVTSFQGIEQADESAICNGLSEGHGIIANVRGGTHWVLLTACAGNGVFYVNDPGFSATTYSMGDILQEAVYH